MSTPAIPSIEEIRRRIMERAKLIRERLVPGRLGGEIVGKGGIVGGGRLITTASETIDKVLQTVKEKRPNVLPTVLERIRTFEPGKRIKEVMPPIEGGETPTREEKKTRLLRR